MTTMGLQYLEYQEGKRSNLAREAETNRHNQESEAVAKDTLTETRRSNLAKEAETNRSNLVNEGIKRDTLDETARSNLVREAETNRHNVATETEDNRHNVASETHNRSVLDETIRKNNMEDVIKRLQNSTSYEVDLRKLDQAKTIALLQDARKGLDQNLEQQKITLKEYEVDQKRLTELEKALINAGVNIGSSYLTKGKKK